MARRTKREKPLIFVFCEGESELAYVEFLRKRFIMNPENWTKK